MRVRLWKYELILRLFEWFRIYVECDTKRETECDNESGNECDTTRGTKCDFYDFSRSGK